ncbi:MAG: DnaJ domain-containing protein [Mycoplasma sp.]
MSSYNETTKFCTSEDVLAGDWYEILGCNTRSTQNDINEAYKTLAKKYHPDKNGNSEAVKKFYQINSAYQILGDRELRAYYDYESGNANPNDIFRFRANNDIETFKEYIDRITDYRISSSRSEDNIWKAIHTKYIDNKNEFNRQINIVGTLDVNRKSLQEGIRTAFPVFHYKTCGVCRGFGKIGVNERETCYNCDGYGIEAEKIFVYVEIPKNYKPEKLFKVPGRGHKIPDAIGDLIIRINPVSKMGMKSRIIHSSLKNKKIKGDY